jgi:hypothetical protein
VSFDTGRFTFNPFKNYSGVLMEQGRVQLDSDWNDWLAELSRRIQAGTLDILCHAAYPPTTPYAFLITFTGGKVTIGPGRMYVDGLLAENHGDPAAGTWDPALAERSGSSPAPARNRNRRHRLHQPALAAGRHAPRLRHLLRLSRRVDPRGHLSRRLKPHRSSRRH